MRSFVRWSMMALVVAAVAIGASLSAQNPPKPQPPAVTSPTQAAGGTRIAFVNANALLKGMPGFAQAESTWNKEAETADGEARKLQAAFDSSVAQFQQSQAMMTPSNRSAKEKQLQAQQDSTQAKINSIRARIEKRQNELLSPMQERLRAVIDGIRAEGNYWMIIDIGTSASIVSYDKTLDITVRVAQRLASSN